MSYTLSPHNDLAVLVTLKDVLPTGQLVNATDGSVTAFIATSNSPTATAAHPSLVGTASYTGNGGRWLVQVEAPDPTVLEPLFGAGGTPYLIVQRAGSSRVFIDLTYLSAKPAIKS